jgi:hypothetical protein
MMRSPNSLGRDRLAPGLIVPAGGRICEFVHGRDGAAEALLTEGEGGLALAVEDAIGVDSHGLLLASRVSESGLEPKHLSALRVEQGREVLMHDLPFAVPFPGIFQNALRGPSPLESAWSTGVSRSAPA